MRRMKKMIAMIMVLMLGIMTLAGAALAEEEATPSNLEPRAEKREPVLLGGWAPAEDPTVTEEVETLLEKATFELLGVTYKPVAYLGSQVVAGTNHAILCQAQVVSPDARPYFVIVYVYEDLHGNVSLLNIADFDVGALCTYGAE